MIYDISLPIRSPMAVWPGDPNVQFEQVCSINAGDDCNVTRICMGLHTGTHVDAPRHYLSAGNSIDSLSLDSFIGPCQVVVIQSETVIRRSTLEPLVDDDCRRLLIKTDNSLRELTSGKFDESFVALDTSAAAFIVEKNVRLVGIDAYSIEPFHSESGNPVHHLLLENDVAILEGLDLSVVDAGKFELLAQPIKIVDADGAPCRALLRAL